MKPFFVYLLRCADDSYYVGHTDNLEHRLAQHQAGEIEGYTSNRRPVQLVWSQETASREEALAAEQQIKGWARAKKEALIRGDWAAVQRHAWGTRNPLPPHLHSPVRAEVSKPERKLSDNDSQLIDGILTGQRRALAKTITLIESSRADHQARAQAVLQALLPHTGNAVRLGVSGVPGVGKSTFIEALGLYLIGLGKQVAVLAVDPSSTVSGGSILGDKTRMEKLSMRPEAFIRPSPTSGALGGVAERTREAMLACEAAGFDVVIVETVGVGQSETAVAGMTDMFCLLQLPNAGDDLQALKKGIVELADMVVINKADIDPAAAQLARAQVQSALALLRPASPQWAPPVLLLSALKQDGIAEFWAEVLRHHQALEAGGELAHKRRAQARTWMWQLIEVALRHRFRDHAAVRGELPALEQAVEDGRTTPAAAAAQLLGLLKID
jgi:LAO/AO transport system kinase